MATADAAPGSLGPQYAPDDPTLPKPWKGLIDGNTGFLYYWNPETNITQYEKPEASVPPLPSVPPPSNSLPKLASIPMVSNFPLNVTGSHQPSQQIAQEASYQTQPQQQPCQPLFQQQGELTESPQQRQQPPPNQHLQLQHSSSQQVLLQNTQMPVHQPHQLPNKQMAPQAPQHYMPIHLQDGLHQHVPYLQGSLVQPPQVQQQHGFQFSNQQVQQSQGPYQQGQQQQGPQGVQIPNQQQQGQQTLGSQTSLSHGYQVLHQDTQHTLQAGQQQGQQSQGLQSGKQQAQQSQGQQPRFPWMEDALHQDGKLGTLPSPGVASAGHHLPDLVSQVGILPGAGHTSQSPNQFGGPSMQNTSPFQARNTGIEANFGIQQQRGTAVPNPSSNPIVRPPVSGKTMYGGTQNEIPGNECFPPPKMERSMMYPHQPRLAALPIPQNQSDPGFRPHFDASDLSGGVGVGPQNTQPNMHGHAAFHNPIVLRPSPGMLGPSDFHNVSAADAYRQHHEVTAMGNDVPLPFMTFEATGFPPEILREMHLAGFSTPTPIQAQTWPVALQNRDIVAIAKTGSGKTLGYLIPAFIHLRHCQNNPQFGPTVLVLAPTRELASQIQEEAFKFGRSSRISCTCLYGGAPKGPQLKEIERGADIVIATPGRLNDFLEMKKISFRQVSFLVLDEADRMLDMGFEPQIRKIVNEIPPQRQTLMYTATWPKEVRKIANDLLKNPVQVNIGSVDELVANKSITQHIEVVAPMDKSRRLEQILRNQERGSKVIIFCSTKRQCDQLARSLGRTFGAASIHGDKSQGERDHVLFQFRTGRAPVLVATDVAARGLDIKDIRVVINFDFPTGIEDYVHRIGRTGRAGATGVAYTFFTDQDWKHAVDLVKVLEGANQRVPPEIREMAGRGGPPLSRPRNEPNRWDSGGGNGGGAGRWNARGCRGSGTREGPSGFAGRSSGGMRDGPGGYGGPASFGGRGGRQDFFGGRAPGGRAPRGRGFGGPGGSGGRGRGRHDWSPHDRSIHSDGRKRYDGRRGFGERGRERSYSRSPEMVRTWGYDRSRGRSGSRSKSRSRSRSWSRSRSRSWSSRSRSRSQSRSRSRSRSRERVKRPSGWDSTPAACPTATPITAAAEAPDVTRPAEGHGPSLGAGHEPNVLASGPMLPTSPDYGNGSLLRNELPEQFPEPDGGSPRDAEHHN